jgi:hypothetical protein
MPLKYSEGYDKAYRFGLFPVCSTLGYLAFVTIPFQRLSRTQDFFKFISKILNILKIHIRNKAAYLIIIT